MELLILLLHCLTYYIWIHFRLSMYVHIDSFRGISIFSAAVIFISLLCTKKDDMEWTWANIKKYVTFSYNNHITLSFSSTYMTALRREPSTWSDAKTSPTNTITICQPLPFTVSSQRQWRHRARHWRRREDMFCFYYYHFPYYTIKRTTSAKGEIKCLFLKTFFLFHLHSPKVSHLCVWKFFFIFFTKFLIIWGDFYEFLLFCFITSFTQPYFHDFLNAFGWYTIAHTRQEIWYWVTSFFA